MAVKFVFVLMLFIAAGLACSGGGGRRSSTSQGDFNCRTTCRRECYRIRNCRYAGCPVEESCRDICTNPCREVKKRSVPDESEAQSLPSKFTAYDSNGDGKITMEEFAAALQLTQEDAKQLFDIIDTNSDQEITCDEFKKATKDVADGKPTCE